MTRQTADEAAELFRRMVDADPAGILRRSVFLAWLGFALGTLVGGLAMWAVLR